jgi:signal transduction histidine kinase
LVGALLDHHLALRSTVEADRLRAYIAELEATKRSLEGTSRDLNSALVRADAANQTKSAFLAAMSHELRTPLNAVIGFSELVLSECFGPIGSVRYKEYIGDIRKSGSHLLSLINDVLDLSRLDAGQASLKEEKTSLVSIFDETWRMVAGQANQAGVTVSIDLPGNLPRIVADPRRIRQVFLNLLSNAVKFTPHGGRVSISASRIADGLSISIADTGIGIAREDIPKALERFGQVDSRLSRRYEGTGLGLPLAKQLVELHGGTFDLQSTVGVGTTVTMTFPIERIVAADEAATAA